MGMVSHYLRALASALALFATSQAFAAEGGTWSVSKSSGEVWISSGGVQQASLKPDEQLKPGDTIRTGRNGRVLLMRGEESILIAPNSVVGLPTQTKEGLSTTITQQAGSILLEVEKHNVKHFEVETPYLAAVVKGTHFRVVVNAASTSVDVMRGQVEVTDFKSGQIAQVMPGQKATAFEHGKAGLLLSGSGPFNPIEQGKPRASSINRVAVPRGGLTVPRSAAIHAMAGHGGLRISSTLGEVKLDFHKVTHGLAHGSSTSINTANRNVDSNTVWNSSSTTGTNVISSATASASSAASSVSSVAAAVAAATNAGSIGGGGNGANGNGNNGSGLGLGNGGVGNGNGKGNFKH
jgi:FecR protein